MDNSLFFDKYFSQTDINILDEETKKQQKIWDINIKQILVAVLAFIILICSSFFDGTLTLFLFIGIIISGTIYLNSFEKIPIKYNKKVQKNVNISKLQNFFKDFYNQLYPGARIFHYGKNFSYEDGKIDFNILSKKNENLKNIVSCIFHLGYGTNILNYSIVSKDEKYLYMFDIEKKLQRKNDIPEFYRFFILSPYEELDSEISQLVPEDKKMILIYFQTFQNLLPSFVGVFILFLVVSIILLDEFHQSEYKQKFHNLVIGFSFVPFLIIIFYHNFQSSLARLLKIPSYEDFLNKNNIQTPIGKMTLKKLYHISDPSYQGVLDTYNYFDKQNFLLQMQNVEIGALKINELLKS